jgi:putative membrane protein
MLNEGPKIPKPQEFAASVAESNGYELAAAQCALAQSRNPRVRSFAEQMIADHENMARALRDAAKAAGLEPPRSHVGGDQARFLSGLQSLRGEEFDREYARQQVLAHTSALATVRAFAEKGSDAELRRLAATAAAVIEHHLRDSYKLQQSFA